VSTLFPGYSDDPAHMPTFRQCLTHMSGLSGHGDWGAARNPHFENVVLNGIDANVPGKTYEYSGKASSWSPRLWEIVTGRSAPHLYHEHLFGPLGMGDVPVDIASSGMRVHRPRARRHGAVDHEPGQLRRTRSSSPGDVRVLLPSPSAAATRG